MNILGIDAGSGIRVTADPPGIFDFAVRINTAVVNSFEGATALEERAIRQTAAISNPIVWEQLRADDCISSADSASPPAVSGNQAATRPAFGCTAARLPLFSERLSGDIRADT